MGSQQLFSSLDFDSKKVPKFRTVKCQSQWDHSSEPSLLPSDVTLVTQREGRPAHGVPQQDALYRVLARHPEWAPSTPRLRKAPTFEK